MWNAAATDDDDNHNHNCNNKSGGVIKLSNSCIMVHGP